MPFVNGVFVSPDMNLKMDALGNVIEKPDMDSLGNVVGAQQPRQQAIPTVPTTPAPVQSAPRQFKPAAIPTLPPRQTAPAPVQTPQPTVSNTPDTSDPVMNPTTGTQKALADKAGEQRQIRTVFQTLTGQSPIPEGEKWRWYLQHGFTGMHGGLHDELMQQVNAEAAAQRAQKNTYGQELRAGEMKRRTLMHEWDKLLWEWNHGYYSGNDDTVNQFYQKADSLKQAMIEAGIEPGLIRDPSVNAGGFAQGFQKSLATARDDLDWLGGWMKSIQENATADPNWLNSTQAQTEFDKMAEYTIIKWAQSKGAIADAEKIRAQVEAMPAQDRKYYNGFMSMFLNNNAMLQLEGLSSSGDRHAKALVQEIEKLANDAVENPNGVVTVDKDGMAHMQGEDHIMNLLALVQTSLIRDNQDLPVGLREALDSYRASRDLFDEYVMRNANVDRQMVWNSAVDQMGINLDRYKRNLPRLGLLSGWDYNGFVPTKDFGNMLAQWQSTQPTDAVIRNARLTAPKPPKYTNDNFGVRALPGAGGVQSKQRTSKWSRGADGKLVRRN